MTITSKYPGRCSKCGAKFMAGTQIEWERGKNPYHTKCPTPSLSPKSEPKPEPEPVPTEITALEYLIGFGSFGPHYDTCGDKTEEFIDRAAKFSKITPDEVVAQLLAGKSVAYDYEMDFGSYTIRDHAIVAAIRNNTERSREIKNAAIQKTHPTMHCQACGQIGSAGDYPFSTNPRSGLCDDCQ